MQDKILSIFRETGALLEGHFVLRSGLHSGHFFQCARVCERMDKVTELTEMLLKKVRDTGVTFDSVLAPAIGGLVIGQEFARQAGVRFIFAEKVDDKLTLRRNFKINAGEKFIVVEDVITRGGRVQESIDIIESHGGIVTAVAVLVDRSEGKTSFKVPHYSLLEFSFPTYEADKLPEHLKNIPASKPGS